jgi:hypothetical protein
MRMRPSDRDLRDALAQALSEQGLSAPDRIRRQRSEYATSFPLEELEVRLEDGADLRLGFKQLDWHCLDETGRLAKPEFLHDPAREPAVYASVLASASLGAPGYYGAVVDPEAGRHWLFVEWVEGRELYQVADLDLWVEAARWLGGMHVSLRGEADRQLPLLSYDEAYYRRWIARALSFVQGESRASGPLEWLAERYDAVVEGLLALPTTLLHGEFYASNVLVGSGGGHPCRVAAVDWELAGRGPGLVDLAALISGGWEEEQRSSMVDAYRTAVGVDSFSSRQLDLARLHLAVQWLGWAPPSWIPPEGQRHDWLGEALRLAEELQL